MSVETIRCWECGNEWTANVQRSPFPDYDSLCQDCGSTDSEPLGSGFWPTCDDDFGGRA